MVCRSWCQQQESSSQRLLLSRWTHKIRKHNFNHRLQISLLGHSDESQHFKDSNLLLAKLVVNPVIKLYLDSTQRCWSWVVIICSCCTCNQLVINLHCIITSSFTGCLNRFGIPSNSLRAKRTLLCFNKGFVTYFCSLYIVSYILGAFICTCKQDEKHKESC